MRVKRVCLACSDLMAINQSIRDFIVMRLTHEGWLFQSELNAKYQEMTGCADISARSSPVLKGIIDGIKRKREINGIQFSVFKLFNPGRMMWVHHSLIWAIDEGHALKGIAVNLSNLDDDDMEDENE